MAGLERLRKKLLPLTDLDDCEPHSPDGTDPKVSADGRSCVQFKISRLCIQKRRPRTIDGKDDGSEQSYHCASDEMCVFEAIGWGASSVVRKAIHIPAHRIIALKKINIFEKEKRQQLLNKIRTLCEAPRAQGLVEFIGAFYNPDSGYINIALEYMDGGSLADIVRIKKCIPEPILSVITHKILQGLQHLHGVRHLVHRDIKPANLLMNLVGEPKITDFGLSAGLGNSISMCATFVGSVTYMSPERIKNERYSYPADIWSLGLSLLECATGEFPYDPTKGNVDVMLQILDDPSPSLPADTFSSEFCSFIDTCLWREAGERASAKEGWSLVT